MNDTQNMISVNFNVKELEAFLDFHIDKAISKAIAAIEKRYTTAKQQEDWLTRNQLLVLGAKTELFLVTVSEA